MSQRVIELIVGRLITDEAFRERFLLAPEATLRELAGLGLDLSRIEIAALVNTDPTIWVRVAEALDPRLQKICLTSTTTGQ